MGRSRCCGLFSRVHHPADPVCVCDHTFPDQNREVERLQAQLTQSLEDAAVWERALVTAQESIQQLEQYKAEAEERAEAAELLAEEKEEELASLRERLQEKLLEMDEVQNSVHEELVEQLLRSEDRVSELELALQEEKDRSRALQLAEETEGVIDCHVDSRERVGGDAVANVTPNVDLNTSAESLPEGGTEAEVSAVNAETAMVSECEELRAQLVSNEEVAQQLRETIHQLRQELKVAQDSSADASRQLTETRCRCEQLQQEMQRIQQQHLLDVEEKQRKWSQQEAALVSQVQKEYEEKGQQSLAAAQAVWSVEKEELRNQIERLQEECQEAQTQMVTLRERVASLQGRAQVASVAPQEQEDRMLEKWEEERASLQYDLECAQRECERLQEQLSDQEVSECVCSIIIQAQDL